MNGDPGSPASGNTPLAPAYTEALRVHALTLVAVGYARMTPANLAAAEEDTITGELTHEMKAAIEEDDAPEWMQDYSVQEQVRANAPDKLGKQRPIVDIEFERHKRGHRPRLRFEAKRLGPNHPASGYFGDGGLEAFVTGYYDRTHEDAGMLAYVQSLDEAEWAARLSAESINRKAALGISESWSHFAGGGLPSFTYKTGHTDHDGKRLDVFHILLRFT